MFCTMCDATANAKSAFASSAANGLRLDHGVRLAAKCHSSRGDRVWLFLPVLIYNIL